jgi:anti-sigma-K factor RskA
MTLHGLTATKGDQVYVVWLSSDNGTPVKVGSFTVDDSGEGGVEVDNVSTSAILWLFVCREPNGNVTKPTGPMVVSGTVSL